MALGLKKYQIFWKVILPQSMKVAIPPSMAMFIAMLKDSSLVSVMGLWEIMFLAQSYRAFRVPVYGDVDHRCGDLLDPFVHSGNATSAAGKNLPRWQNVKR